MSKVGGQVPGASVVGSASCPALHTNTNTAVIKGPDKFTSSSQAADDMVAPNQPTDNTTVSDSLLDVAPPLHESTDVTTAEHHLTDVTTAENQLTDVTLSEHQLTDVTTAEHQLTNVTTAKDQLTDVTLSEHQLTDITIAEYHLNDVTTSERQLTDVTTSERQLNDVTTSERQLNDVSRCKHEFSEYDYDGPDFLILPLLVWLKIFSLLNQRDRFVLSVTCRTLYDIFRKSSVLWQSVIIDMKSGKPYREVNLTATDSSLLEAHCHQMENLVFNIRCKRNLVLSESSRRLLCEAARVWPLKQLEVRTEIGRGKMFSVPISKHVQQVLHTCITSPSATQLSSLKICIRDWRASREGTSGVVEALKDSSFKSSLTVLYLGLVMPGLCDSDELCKVIGTFQNLQYLNIGFKHLSDSLLNNISSHLKNLHFLVNIKDEPREVTNWPQVLTSSPQLTVGLSFVQFPLVNITSHILPSVVPVSSIRIKNTSPGCSSIHSNLLQLLPQYCSHLQVLRCRLDHVSNDDKKDFLLTAVSQSPKLDSLDYRGSISSDTVLSLATMREWTKLEFNAKSISFGNSKDREEKMQALCEQVSSVLGRDWKPRSWDRTKTLDFTQTNYTTRPIAITVHPGHVHV